MSSWGEMSVGSHSSFSILHGILIYSLVFLLLLAAIPALVLLHLAAAPYTKVEESFHIQAIHDILSSGIPTRNVSEILRTEYDHFTFPGAVPRTFVGAVMLSGLSQPFIWLKANIDRQFLGMCFFLAWLEQRL